MALVLDTSVVYAALDLNEPDHELCAGLVSTADEQLIIPDPVLVELDYFIRKFASVDAWLSFAENVREGAYSIWAMDSDLLVRAADLQARFSDQPIGLVDASVFVTCELLGEDKVATLDHRHFSVLRTADGRALRLLPEGGST